jgi:hypothetical protein
MEYMRVAVNYICAIERLMNTVALSDNTKTCGRFAYATLATCSIKHLALGGQRVVRRISFSHE